VSIRAILVPTDGDQEWLQVLEAALVVAKRFDSHISVLHVAESTAKTGLYASLSRELKNSVRNEEKALLDERAGEIEQQVKAFAKRKRLLFSNEPQNAQRVTVSFHFEIGNRKESLVQWARLFDTTAVKRPAKSSNIFRHTTDTDSLETVMLQSGRPLLMVPPNWKVHKAQHAVVAWNHSLESSRAVAMTLPWLVEMKKVTVVVPKNRFNSGEKLVEILAWHGAKATVQALNRRTSTVAKRLLRICENEGADFLVMGGYSHSRVQERVFGGVTDYVLSHSKIITVMVH